MTNTNSQPIQRVQGEKGFAIPIIIAIITLVVVVTGIGYFTTQTPTSKKEDVTPVQSGVERMMTKYTGTVLAGKSAVLLDYNKADYDAAITSDKLIVLYFYANWCPICKAETANALYPAFNELTTDKVVGIRVSYKDNETDSDEKTLAVQLGIPYQHTKVFLKNGKQILKAPDGWDKARYIMEINKALAK